MRAKFLFTFIAFALPPVVAVVAVRGLAVTPASAMQVASSGVLHTEADELWLTGDGVIKRERRTEFWLDTATGDARLVEKDATGAEENIFVRGGLAYTHNFSSQQYAVVQVAADSSAPWLSAVRDFKLGYRVALDNGAQSIGEEVIDGLPAIKIRLPSALHGVDVIEAFVDKVTGLPLRVVAYRGATGAFEEVERHLLRYRRIEHLDRQHLPARLFSTDVPSGWRHTTTRYLTPAAARSFKKFDIYWLGPSYGGLPLAAITHVEALRKSGPITSVAVVYHHPFVNGQRAPGQVSVVQRPPVTAEEVASARMPKAGGSPESVSVDARQATLYVDAPGASARLELTIGGTFITVHGSDRAEVLRAASALQKLN